MKATGDITVVAAVIRDQAGRVLLARRPDHTHMGGLWEFPGGKIRAGENPRPALVRELREELGVEASIGERLASAIHEEPGLKILLLFFAARLLEGQPVGREGQDVRWVHPTELPDYPTPPADAELVALLAAGRLS
jgi:8-oxo-dGTP diphosphatase